MQYTMNVLIVKNSISLILAADDLNDMWPSVGFYAPLDHCCEKKICKIWREKMCESNWKIAFLFIYFVNSRVHHKIVLLKAFLMCSLAEQVLNLLNLPMSSAANMILIGTEIYFCFKKNENF